MYEYRMVQVPPNVITQAGQRRGDEAARYLEDLVSRAAADGFEFWRLDPFRVIEPVGCGCMTLFGAKPVEYETYVVTFRRPRA